MQMGRWSTHPWINSTINPVRKISLPQLATQIPVSTLETLNVGLFVSLLEGLEKSEAPGVIPRGGHKWDGPVSWLAERNIGENTILRVGQVQVVST